MSPVVSTFEQAERSAPAEAPPRGTTVSVVIPTRGRPALVCRAVRSALAQTHGAMEVVVVVDGPDAETERALEGLDARVLDRKSVV